MSIRTFIIPHTTHSETSRASVPPTALRERLIVSGSLLLVVASVLGSACREKDAAQTAPSVPSTAGMTYSHYLGLMSVEEVAADSNYDAIVATITGVSNDRPTNGNPPMVTLAVHEVLRGDKNLDRTRAFWAPFPHDVDWSNPRENPIVKEWESRPMQPPRIGEKKILFGHAESLDGKASFWVEPSGRFDYSDENRMKALRGIEAFVVSRKKAEAEREAEKREYETTMKAWRAKYSDEDIRRFAAKADFVGVGRVVSGPDVREHYASVDFAISRILEGERRRKYADSRYFVIVRLSPEVGRLLYPRDRDFVLFLSEENMKYGDARDYYVPIGDGDGVVEADPEALNATEAALSGRGSVGKGRRKKAPR